jgi:hypothetical protein
MKKNIIIAAAALSSFAFQSCHKTSGDGPSVTKDYNLSGFTSIDAGLEGDVYYTQSSTYKVEIYAQTNVHELIETPIVDGELHLQFKKFSKLGRHDRVVVYISAPSVNGLGVNGSGHLRVTQPMNSANVKVNGSGDINIASYTGDYLSANISGSGHINVNGGTARSTDLHISGSGDIDMLNLDAESVKTNTSGSGNTTVSASKYLDVRISGSGDVYYRGNPSVNASISGSGKVSHI